MNFLRALQRKTTPSIRVGTAVLLVVVPTLFYYLLVDSWDVFPDVLFFELRHRIHGSLYLVAFAYASLFLAWRGYALVWVASFLIHLSRGVRFSLSTEALVGNLFFWSLPLLAGAIVVIERQWRLRQRNLFAEREQERELYLRRILMAEEDERRAIAEELHDEPLQDLIALAYGAEAAVNEIPETFPQARAKVAWIREQCVRVSRELRRISYDLRPSILDQLGLVPALRWLTERMTTEGHVTTELAIEGQTERMDRQVESCIFRVVQEALTNIRKHSGAGKASVLLTYTPDSLWVKIEDNGRGFEVKGAMERLASDGHMGILGMRERAAAIGGDLVFESGPATGTRLRLRVPRASLVAHGTDSASIS